jgi:hypothetical protein
MKKIVFLLGIVLLIFGSWFKPRPALAVNLTVTCTTSDCAIVPANQPLFEVANWLPGDSTSQQITVINQNPDDACNLYLNTTNENDPDNLASAVFTVIKEGMSDIFGVRDGDSKASSSQTLADLFGTGSIFLGTIGALDSKTFDWVATFDLDADNGYQEKSITFDFDLSFSCGIFPEPALAPTPTPTPFSTTTGGSGGGVAAAGGVVGAFVAAAPPAGLKILGESQEAATEGELGGGVSTEAGETKGITISQKYFWWLIFALIGGIISFALVRRRKDKSNGF